MKDFANPSYVDKTIDEKTLQVGGLTFRLSAVRQHTKENLNDFTWKSILSVDINDFRTNASVRIQQEWFAPEDVKALGHFLLDNAEKIQKSLLKEMDKELRRQNRKASKKK